MQLSKLEIKGFKSFGDKVTVNFDEGITGIVGPNGCGKSNIVDAIRWVLGEQKTKALRSDKMENVIFNGTKNRKALQMAEVSLTFNNTKNLLPTEYAHVTITRRYYRSGESEYLLNSVTCRLKDITNLFLDTGIGSDSYAIIELKMVDDILNDKDNSRRSLFEEAAGISKFKIRKKQTLKKLEETDKDLERVEDLLFEIVKNLKSLEKQAKQTEKYFQIKENYKNSSIELAKVTIQKHTTASAGLHTIIQKEQDAKLELLTKITDRETESEKWKATLINFEKLLSGRQKSLNEHVAKIRQYESDKKIKNERLRYLNDKHSSLLEQIENDKKSNERADFSINSLLNEKANVQKIFDEVEARLFQYKQEYESQKTKNSSIQEEVNLLNNKFRSKQEEVYQLNKSLEIYNIQLSSLKQELEKTSYDDSSHLAYFEQFETKLQELSSVLQLKNEQFEEFQLQEEELMAKSESVQKEIERIKERLTHTNRKLDAKQNEYNLTKSMVDNLEGFPEAIKFLKKNASWGKDTPLLSDVITCDEKYRLSIENFLEPFMNYYVVDNENQALQAVNLLSDASKGKANFFILSNFTDFKAIPSQELKDCRYALEIAEYDPKYKQLVEYLLDQVYIVANNQDDLPVYPGVTVITINGKINKRKYSISGGSIGLFEGKRIGRVKNLEKLQKEIKGLLEDLQNIKASLENKQKELFRLRESTKKRLIETLRKEITLVHQEHITIKTKREQFAQMIEGNALKKEDIQEKIEKIQEEIENNGPRAEEKKEGLITIEETLKDKNEELIEQNHSLAQKFSLYNQENILYHQHENKIKSLEQETNYKKAAFETSRERIRKNMDDSKKTGEEIRQLLEKADVNDDELLEFYKEKENIEGGVSEAEKEYYSARAKIEETEKEIREIRKLKERAESSVAELQNKMNENKLTLTSIKERLSVEFNMNMDEIEGIDIVDRNQTEEELKNKVYQIKNSLEKLGPINPLAMEAFREIQERHTFIAGQRDDLAKAKDSLLQTIGEIDVVARVTFMEAYDKIRENFIKVFRSLFTEEDTCDLKLSDPDNPLDSAIEILARPKGKRPLTINQLSGGEKTLTAISLLFAIYLIKPAPFCIFDEVDAPLDDANIDKFNNIIKKFSSESQFIIVTHNKRTMASTDVIYGITMIEQGISRLVPVDLRSLA